MATVLTKTVPYQPQDNSLVVALSEPNNSANVWRMSVKAKIGGVFQRVGPQFDSIAPLVSTQGGNRVVAVASLSGVTEWEVTAETPLNGQPGSIETTVGPENVNVPPPLTVVEGTPVPAPPPATGEGARNVAWVATFANGGNDGTGQIGRIDRPFSTINAAINAVLAQSVDRRPGVVRVAAGTYLEGVSLPAQSALNGVALIADGEVVIDATSLPNPALAIFAGSISDAQAVETLTIGGQSWRLVKGGGIALSIAGQADPNGYFHMGTFNKGGLQLENMVLAGSVNLQWLGLLTMNNVVQPEPDTNAIENVSALRLTGGSVLQNIDLTYDPTADLDTQPQPSPPLGLVVGAGCQVGDIDAIGAPRVLVEKGGSMRAFNGASWSEFFSAAPPAFDAAPALVCYGKAVGNHNWPIPAESAGAIHTEVSYRGVDYDGEMTGSKLAGVSRVFCDLLGGVFSGPLDFSGLVTIGLRGSTYSEGLLTSAAAAEIDQSAFSIDTATVNGALPVAFSNPLPAGVGTDYTVSIEPDATGFSAADVFVSNKTPAGFDLNATAVLPVRLRIERNPLAMTLHRLSKGSGSTRDLVLVYHVDPIRTGPSLVSACPDAVVGVEVYPPGGKYNPGKGLLPLADAINGLRGGEGWELGLLLLVGFSEGCQGVRSALLGGSDPSAVLAIDGIHASSPPAESQLAPWQAYCARAKEETRLAYLTHTQIDTTGYLPTKEVVPMVAGLSPIDTAWEWENSEIPGGPHTVARDGFLWVGGWPGKDARAHIDQQVVVLPYLLEWLLVTARAHRGDLPPRVAPGGGGAPPPVQPVPGGGGGARPPAKPPAGGGAKPPPGPPAPASSGGGDGAGLLALGGFLALGLAMGRRR